MPLRKYKGLSLRNRIFWGFLVICGLSILGSTVLSFFVLRDSAINQSKTDQQHKVDALMASLDYAVSHSQIETEDLKAVLSNEIYEIADITKRDVILYDLNGNYLISNKDPDLMTQKQVSVRIINRILGGEERVDVVDEDQKLKAKVISSYMLLRNNMLEPIGIVYTPYYHSDSGYLEVFNRYLKYIILVNIVVIGLGILLSWIISKHLARTIGRFSDLIARVALFDQNIKPIRYYRNDELGVLVQSYNKMILQIQDQKERLSQTEKEIAWREMARQVAHEVKNPLTPMKLKIQNFDRKFDPQDPDIKTKVKDLCDALVDQIDLIASVASAFSQFAQLPEKHNEVFELKSEVKSILHIFGGDHIFIHSNKDQIMINMDKIYLNRMITNLITNSKQAESPERELLINVDIEQIHKKVKISVEDNGIGIEEDQFEKIFEPNFTSKSSGMGLGLSMVKKMVEDYKGEIVVSSEIGYGAKFTITLPTNV